MSLSQLVNACTYRRVYEVNNYLQQGVKPGILYDQGQAHTSPLLECALHSSDWGKENYHLKIMRLLIEANADVNEADCLGNTPLLQALCVKSTEAVRVLLENGAKITDKIISKPIFNRDIFMSWKASDAANVCIINGQKYHLVKKIGDGEGGEVYEANKIGKRARVAIKMLWNIDDPEVENRKAVEKYRGYYAIVDCVVKYIDSGNFLGKSCIVMEYVDGVSLSEYEYRHGYQEKLSNQIDSVWNFFDRLGLRVSRENPGENVLVVSEGRGKFKIKVIDLGYMVN